MKAFVWDLETNGLLKEELVDYSSFPYKLKPNAVIHCGWVFDIDTGERWGYRPHEIHLLVEKLKEADVLIGHNTINFDHLFLKLKYGCTYTISEHAGEMDEFCGKPIRIIDTLVLSKVLNPDRRGGHSLKQWGKTLNNNKIIFGDEEANEAVWEVYSEEMYIYCEQDVNLNVDVYHALIAEMNLSGGWDRWERSFRLEQAVKELITRQEHMGFAFNKDKAEGTVKDLNRLLAECEAEAEPHLPPKTLPKSKQPNFPAKPFLQSGAISKHGYSWIEKIGATDKNEEEQKEILRAREPFIATEPMKLSSQVDVKSYLVGLGWRPTKWNERDLFTETDKKTPSTEEQYKKRILTYINNTVGTPFEEYRLRQLNFVRKPEYDDQKCKQFLWTHLINCWNNERVRKLMAYTLPKFTVDMDKNLCPNLERLVDEIPYSKAIVHWLTYRHRRNSILSPNGTGWLTQRRESDGRIPTPADSNGCNTSRMKHIGVANVPRVTSLYGAPLRELFEAGEGYYQIGTDGDAIEARVQGHYIMPYKGGVEEAALLLAPKPNDVHTVTALALAINRDQAKTVRYSISYGAQPPKLAADNGWTLARAKEVFNEFWKQNAATAALKADLIKFWEGTGKKYIIGIDDRLLATRSAHSLLNTLFQSCGVIIMKKAHIISDRKAKAEGYCNDPFEGRPTAISMICYHEVRGFK